MKFCRDICNHRICMYFWISFIALSCAIVNAIDEESKISFAQFKQLLFSEAHNHVGTSSFDLRYDNSKPGVRALKEYEETKWDIVLQHGWDDAGLLDRVKNTRRKTSRNLRRLSNRTAMSSYIVCSHSSIEKSAFQRISHMLNRTQSHLQDYAIIRNDPHMTCFHVSMTYDVAITLQREPVIDGSDNRYSVIPLVDLMKVQIDTFKSLFDDSWSLSNKHDKQDRIVSVAFSVGHRKHLNESSARDMATLIIDDVRYAGQVGAFQRKRTKHNLRRLSMISSANATDVDGMHSLSNMFSLMKDELRQFNRKLIKKQLQNKTDMSHINQSQWDRSLQLGLEADHGCEAMFHYLEVNTYHNFEGFDIVLKSPKKNYIDDIEGDIEKIDTNTGAISTKDECNEGIEKCSSTSNKHCVISLIMGLATHSMVMSIENSELSPVLSNDYESQWITQTKVLGKRPLKDIGINGENQIISIVDSGLDINHKYFGPTDPRVFNQWDYSQRKVVRYDYSNGDKIDLSGGHGTQVAGAAAGTAESDENDEANGIAQGSKLHVFDTMVGSGAYQMTVDIAYRLFDSMHDTEGKSARVAVGSFSTRYRPYPFTCKYFDEALHGQYKGDLYVASAGNLGLNTDSYQSEMRTIGNPGSCKNTLAVGASQSDGKRLFTGAKGKDYIAAFSSRGPTYDGRMKPDLVAPGVNILTAMAQHHTATVLASGTSFSAPNVAGNAALVRQYFEEGHFPCNGSNNCSFDPSGSLVKAVLMNSARSIKGVQISRPWIGSQELEEVNEYDDNQGMGLIQLDNTLPIPTHNRINAIVRNNKEIRDRNVHDIYIRASPIKCLGKPYIREFSATLAWYDPAGSLNCAKCLVNDLDIMVHEVTANRTVKFGTKIFPNGLSHKDYDNNVERIRFNMKGIRRYRIRIRASNLGTARTSFSLIASGCFTII